MNHLLRVAVSQGRTDVFDDLTNALLRVIRLGCQMLEQLFALHILHHQVDKFVVVVGFVILNNAGMVKFIQHVHFRANQLQVVLKLVFVEHFDSDKQMLVVD